MSSYLTIPPPLYAIVSFDLVEDFQDLSEKILAAKIQWIQLRNKGIIPETDFIEYARGLIKKRDLLSPSSKIIINDDPILAKEIGADGVHLGQGDMQPKMAREILGKSSILGLSTNNISQGKSAPLEVLSYLACGPVFLSSSKSGHADPIGVQGTKEITSSIGFPFVAIGGIDLSNAKSVFNAGAKSIAMIGEVLKNKDNLEYLKLTIDDLKQD